MALVTLLVTVLYTTLTQKLIKTGERNLEAQRSMFAMERTPYMVFVHKSFNAGFLQNSNENWHRIDAYFKNVSKVRISYHFEDFTLSNEDGVIDRMHEERQRRARYILPEQERHHFIMLPEQAFTKDARKWYYFEYTLVYESCEPVHEGKYKSRRRIQFLPEAYGSAENFYLHWSVLSEYDGIYENDTATDDE